MLPFAPDEVRALHDESTENLERLAQELRADGDHLWAKGSKQAADRCHDKARSIEGLVARRRRRG